MSEYPGDLRIDSKGKYYTKVVSTQELEVIVQLRSGQTIEGSIHVHPDRRLSDEMNDDSRFLSVTGAVVSQEGQELYRTSYISVNRAAIQWVIPTRAVGEPVEALDG